MTIANTPAGTPIPIPIFAPVDRPDSEGLDRSGEWVEDVKEEFVDSVVAEEAVCEAAKDVGGGGGGVDDGVEVEVEVPELMPGTPMVVKASGSASKVVVLKLVAQSHGPPRQQKDLWVQKVMELPPSMASVGISQSQDRATMSGPWSLTLAANAKLGALRT